MNKRMGKTRTGVGKKGRKEKGRETITDRAREKSRMSPGNSLDAVWNLKVLNCKLFNISEPHILIYRI